MLSVYDKIFHAAISDIILQFSLGLNNKLTLVLACHFPINVRFMIFCIILEQNLLLRIKSSAFAETALANSTQDSRIVGELNQPPILCFLKLSLAMKAFYTRLKYEGIRFCIFSYLLPLSLCFPSICHFICASN